MKLKWLAAAGILLLAAQASAADETVLKSREDKISYGIGVDMARDFKRQGIEVNVDMLMKGMKDGQEGKNVLMTDEDLRTTLNAYQAELKQKQEQARKTAAENNKKLGDAFLAENKTKEGVVTLPSGLQYKIIKKGDGKLPTITDTVECNYRGTLVDGTEFDSSAKRGQPLTIKVQEGIPGWREAMLLMPIGSKWQLFIPPELAYGDTGAGNILGPSQTLLMEVEVLAIK